jgi:hypothetical protein
MKYLFLFCILITSSIVFAQTDSSGLLTGNVLDEKNKPLEGVSVQLISMLDSSQRKNTASDKTGYFIIEGISFGYYRLRLSYVGMQIKTIDSLYFRAERFDFNMNDIVLQPKSSSNLEEVVVYAEKPLIQSKDGNITFNAAESALSAGSNASELLTNVPLITKDPNGKLLVRGKEPKILIDDKPVELNQQQLQDLLESLPGSTIEKIEVMTNPPPQYANEQGGVINITTRKGKVGKSGRITVSGGTRGEASVNGNYNYRKQGFAMNINAGISYNEFRNEGYSTRQNINTARIYHTESNSSNNNWRPNFRANLDYDISKMQALNLVLNYNQNRSDNASETDFFPTYRLSHRVIGNNGRSYNPHASLTWTMKTKTPGETLKIITGLSFSHNANEREFYQQFLNPDFSFSGVDSLLLQDNRTKTTGYNIRVNYDRPLANKKTHVSAGGFMNASRSRIDNDADYKSSVDGKMTDLSALTYKYNYRQYVSNLRASVRQLLAEKLSVTAGLSAEHTRFDFDVKSTLLKTENAYWSLLPFGNFNKNWNNIWNFTASYRRAIRRPGYGELSPVIDSSDLFNLRSGNPELMPAITENFDLVFGRTKKDLFLNIGLGYNIVEDVFNNIRTEVNDSTTLQMWQNSSGKREMEVSTWNGYTVSKKTKINASASYTYHMYSGIDKSKRNFKDGGSITSNLNANYAWSDLLNLTGSFTFNRFSSPQGSARSSLSMNIGIQYKAMQKKMNLTLNFIDPFRQQEYTTFTYGTNFILENYNTTRSRNIRFTVSYNFTKAAPKRDPKKDAKNKEQLKKLITPKS